ncbi:MAG: hypothetical protein COA74_08715 [Gammaproteobacteria bacterium]|nr:MAG: hypothetical protein COA74_08715 [Gammaproteobacteria bacterium]
MDQTSMALLGYIAVMLMLLVSLATYRSILTLSGSHAANSFSTTGEEVSLFCKRLCRAHANCYESFPIVGGMLLFSIATNNTAITDPLAMYVLGGRLLQTLVHLSSTSILAVYARFGFFLVQLSIVAYWMLLLIGVV